MTVLGTHRTMTTGVTAGVIPTASLVATGLGEKLRLNLGAQVILVSLGANPREALQGIRDDLDAILTESKEAA